MSKFFSNEAWAEYQYLINKDMKLLRKLNRLLDDIERNGNEGIGHPEPLKHKNAGYWSRRIDDKNRLVYKLSDDGKIDIVQCIGHYDDK